MVLSGDHKPIIDQYNTRVENAGIPTLKVSWDVICSYHQDLQRMSGVGLVDTLVYSPKDFSVYVRSKQQDGSIVDVALCTQDVTNRSEFRLNDDSLVTKCTGKVGKMEDRVNLPRVSDLNPEIVPSFVNERYVHRIIRFGEVRTIELARSYSRDPVGKIPIQIAADEIWGERDHDRVRLDYNESEDHQRILTAWLICMTLFLRETRTDEQEEVERFIVKCHKNFEARKMTENHVNYESLFRSKGGAHREGRLCWPLVLALCTAKNLKEEYKDITIDEDDQRKLGTYKGMFNWKHYVCAGFAACLASLFIVAAVVLPIKFEADQILPWLIPALLTAFGVATGIVNYFFLESGLPWAFLILDDREPPTLKTDDRDLAIRLLLSPSCRRHFSGGNLSFTGQEYQGSCTFPYRFTYDDLRALGFGFYCDSSGREYLRVPRVPREEEAWVRMARTDGTSDTFGRVGKVPDLVFEKNWYCATTSLEERKHLCSAGCYYFCNGFDPK